MLLRLMTLAILQHLTLHLSATTVIGAVNELSAAVSAGLAVNIEDAASTVQQVAAGQSITFLGTSNQTDVVVSSPDTVTVSLPASINLTSNVTAGGTIQGLTATLYRHFTYS